MNWQEIINNSELVYASEKEDRHFRTWSLKKTICIVEFYESYDILNIDTIICSILEKSAGEMLEEELATVLGFNVIDNFNVSPKRYADKAEFHIFQEIIKPLFNWGLLERINDTKKPIILKLTSLGFRALKTGKKYKFFSGKKQLLEHENITPTGLPETIFFPYYAALGECTEITNKSQIGYEKIKLKEVFNTVETDLIKQHKLQSKEEHNIYYSEQTKYFDFGSCQVDIRLFKYGNEYLPIIFYNNQVCIEATELLNHQDNSNSKQRKTEWGLYLKLLKDPNAILEFNTIIPFEDLIDLDSLIKDTRLIWTDNLLFQFIADKADANQWFAISNHCPVEVIKLNIQKYKDNWDWTSLSVRIDNEFIINNATNYAWDYEVISSKESVGIEVIKTLLLIPGLKEQEWNWDTIMPQLDFDFIKSNIDQIDFELSELTASSRTEVKSLIAQYPDKKWDWIHISDEYELSFILDNILIFSKHIQLKKILHRAFTSDKYVDLFAASGDLETLLAKTKETELLDYSPNQAEYLWNSQLIDLLERNNLLSWEGGAYTLGFACNPHIKWTYDYFEKYHSKVTSSTGCSFISKVISDTGIVNDFLSFNWDWDIISTNPDLIKDQNFVLQNADDKLNYTLLIESVSGDLIEELFKKAGLLTFLSKNPESWHSVTEKCSVDFVRNHINYEWDWSILTKRFCSTINIEALGNPKWIDKWDWNYLTRNLKLNQIYENIDSYVEYWDWNHLTEKTDKEFILNNLQKHLNYWNWEALLNVRLDKSDLLFTTFLEEIATCISKLENKEDNGLWKAITQKFDYNELKTLIEQSYQKGKIDLYQWDYKYFYSLSQFNVRQYLSESIHLVDWSTLSSSKALNNLFFWDKSLFGYDVWHRDIVSFLENDIYQWNFKGLSQLDSINWNEAFLKIKTQKWDWDYLSEFSGCFKKREKVTSRFKTFGHYINYQFLSKRTDSIITPQFISDNINKNWDWGVLSKNRSISFTSEFIKTNKDREWDWDALSIRNDIVLNNATLIELSDKTWNWEELYKRADITFEEVLIDKLSDKPLDWFAVSQNSTFEPSAKVLSLLKGKSLDWNAISRNSNLHLDILWDYRDKLNWKYIIENDKIDIADFDILNKYQDYVDWAVISQSKKFTLSIENLTCFKNKLVWSIINQRLGDKISEECLTLFADILNWSNISKSMELNFTENLIEKYREYWDWQSLRDNCL